MRVTVEAGRVVRIQGDLELAKPAGALCTRVSRCAERTDHDERQPQPFWRIGPKGHGEWMRAPSNPPAQRDCGAAGSQSPLWRSASFKASASTVMRMSIGLSHAP